jgi:hypothetical protein
LLVGEVLEVDEDCWLVAALGLRDVVVDECVECCVAVFFEAAFDEERAATAYGGVGDTDVFWRGCGVVGCRLWARSAGQAGFFLGWCAVLVGGGAGSRSEGP